MHNIVFSNDSHLSLIAKCHRSAFPHSLSSAFGIRFLKVMYSWYFTSDKLFLFHLENDSYEIMGYCGGILSDGSLKTGSTSGMAQHTFKAAIFAFLTHPWVIFHKEIRIKWKIIWLNIFMKLGIRKRNHFTQKQIIKMSIEPSVGLVVVGLNPKFQGFGYGSLLLNEFERIAMEKYNVKKIVLTVNSNNLRAIRAYEKNGWVIGDSKNQSLNMYKFID